jgi:hypothetical protein
MVSARREEVGKVSDLPALGATKAIELALGREADSERVKLICESGAPDPPERLEQLDEGDAGRI